ncbi:MAG: PAS domain-containing protein [Planctomycetota bacterium]
MPQRHPTPLPPAPGPAARPGRGRAPRPTGVERTFGEDEIIVSKTDTKGRITYANRVFLRVAGYTEAEILGAPHSVLRHPDMPRCVFQLLWDTIQAGREIFAYVINLAQNGDHYWVLAHVTPTYDDAGQIVGYHSMRRKPNPAAVERVKTLYAALRAEEARHENRAAGIAAAMKSLQVQLDAAGVSYEEFAFALCGLQ